MQDTLLECYQSLRLSDVSSEWVEAIWSSDFCECEEITPEDILPSLVQARQWRDVVRLTRSWVEENSDRGKVVIYWYYCSVLRPHPLS